MNDVGRIISQENREEIENRLSMMQKQLECSLDEMLMKTEMYYSERVENILQSEIYDENRIKQLLNDLFEYGNSTTIKQLYLELCAFLYCKNPGLAERYVIMLWMKFGLDDAEEEYAN